LTEELEATRLYAELQCLRFGDDLRVRFEAEAPAGEAAVPSLVLQPLVENAIVHGRDPSRPLQVAVRASKENGELLLEVEDDGRGLGVEGVLAEGVGLSGSRSRLALLYGSAQHLELRPRAGGGAVVRLRIPFSPWPRSPGPQPAEPSLHEGVDTPG
jgi:sensor histidine kinase YesM